jgi:hypothetical protein
MKSGLTAQKQVSIKLAWVTRDGEVKIFQVRPANTVDVCRSHFVDGVNPSVQSSPISAQ